MAIVTGIFPNFASALAACGQGYNDAELADVVAYMTTAVPIDNLQVAPEQAVNSILAAGIAAAETSDRGFRAKASSSAAKETDRPFATILKPALPANI
jgi:hypothetical protein